MIRPLASPVLAVVLGGGFLMWLRTAGYSWPWAALLSGVVLGGAGVVVAALWSGHSLWLSLGVAAVAASAMAFAVHEDARRIILLGGSLAVVQVFDPLGGLIVAGLLPATLILGRGDRDARQTAGLYALLLFVPLVAATLLLYLTRVQHLDPAGFLAGAPVAAPARAPGMPSGLPSRLTPALALAVIVSPALLGLVGERGRGARSVSLVAMGVAAAAVAAALLSVMRDSIALIATSAPIIVAALTQRPETPTRGRDAVGVAALCTGLSWVVVSWWVSVIAQGGS